jgi:peroxiredoxin
MMKGLEVGQVAPSFRLPSGQGPEVSPDDYRGRRNVIVWFTKGMGCAFCRQHMTQLLRGYPTFQGMNTELLEVTPTPPERARMYTSKFNIPFPYLCDPNYGVWRSWGLDVRSHSIGWYAAALYHGLTTPDQPSDFGKVHPALKEFPSLLTDEDMGFYILDRNGLVRYTLAGSYADGRAARQIPSNEEIIRELTRCERAPA